MGFEGLAGVSLFTTAERFDALVAFYTHAVGLTPDPPGGGLRAQRVAYTWGTPPARVRLIISTHDAVTGANEDPNRVMVNLLTTNLEEVARGMAERGVTFTHGPMAMAWGGKMATFRDPDGNTMQLLQPA
jgi:predicted enzyme related to lactoylglutathione lyase